MLDNYSLYAGLDGENLFTLAATRLRTGVGAVAPVAHVTFDPLVGVDWVDPVQSVHLKAGTPLYLAPQAEVERLARQYREVLNDFSATAHELESARAEVNRLMKERQELIDGFDRLGAARNGITEQVWAILGGQDETRPGGCNLVGRVGELHARATTAEADLATARQQIERLREALTPFAEAADAYEPDEGDGASMAWQHDFSIAALRRARAALRESGE
jgi:uncharacterized protein (DUF3084 family)